MRRSNWPPAIIWNSNKSLSDFLKFFQNLGVFLAKIQEICKSRQLGSEVSVPKEPILLFTSAAFEGPGFCTPMLESNVINVK